jgi:HEAT repeat protein
MRRVAATLALLLTIAGCGGEASLSPERAAEIGQLIAELESDDLRVSTAAADRLMRIGPPARAAVPALIRNLGTGAGKRQILNVMATNALLRIGPRAALGPLMAALDDEDRDVAYGAAFTLGGYGRAARSAVPALQRAVQDPYIGGAAQNAIAMIRGER